MALGLMKVHDRQYLNNHVHIAHYKEKEIRKKDKEKMKTKKEAQIT